MNNPVVEKIIAFFEENEDIFAECIEELDDWNGYLGDDRYYYMEELPELLGGLDPLELLQRAYWGHDGDAWCTNSSFNPNREYFYFNGYGNLVSSDHKDYSAHLDSYAVNAIFKELPNLDSVNEYDELAELFGILEG